MFALLYLNDSDNYILEPFNFNIPYVQYISITFTLTL